MFLDWVDRASFEFIEPEKEFYVLTKRDSGVCSIDIIGVRDTEQVFNRNEIYYYSLADCKSRIFIPELPYDNSLQTLSLEQIDYFMPFDVYGNICKTFQVKYFLTMSDIISISGKEYSNLKWSVKQKMFREHVVISFEDKIEQLFTRFNIHLIDDIPYLRGIRDYSKIKTLIKLREQELINNEIASLNIPYKVQEIISSLIRDKTYSNFSGRTNSRINDDYLLSKTNPSLISEYKRILELIKEDRKDLLSYTSSLFILDYSILFNEKPGIYRVINNSIEFMGELFEIEVYQIGLADNLPLYLTEDFITNKIFNRDIKFDRLNICRKMERTKRDGTHSKLINDLRDFLKENQEHSHYDELNKYINRVISKLIKTGGSV